MLLDRPSKESPYLVYHSVPSEASIVDDDVDLARSKFRGFLHQLVNVLCVQHVARYGGCLTTGVIDGFCDCIRLGCSDDNSSASGPW